MVQFPQCSKWLQMTPNASKCLQMPPNASVLVFCNSKERSLVKKTDVKLEKKKKQVKLLKLIFKGIYLLEKVVH